MRRSGRGGYDRRLVVLLSTAGFFATYDASVLALLLVNIQATFSVSEATLGLVRVPIELGLVTALFVARLADRVGRKPVLLWSVVGYTAATALTAFSWDLWSFAAFQFAARVFVGAELAVAVTMVVEELPTGRRARGLGALLAVEALGTIAVAVLLGVGLQNSRLGWRAFFLVGLAPLVVVGICRRGLRETARFRLVAGSRAPGTRPSLFEPWRPETRRNLLVVGLVYLLRSVPLYGAVAWWAYFAQRERGFRETDVAVNVVAAFGLGCAGYYVCGRLMEAVGRRPTAMIYLPVAVASTIVVFQAGNRLVGFVALMLAVATGLGMQPVLSAFATELFPTGVRGQAAAWARNGFEIAGLVLGPALVGVLGDHVHGAVGSIGDAASLLALLALPAVYLVWRFVPETRGRELDDGLPPAGPPRAGLPVSRRARSAPGVAGAVACLVVAVVIWAITGRSAPRVNGVAERWLDAIGDSGRPGRQDEAVARASAIGPVELAASLLPPERDPRGYFPEIEVARGQPASSGYRVPFRVGRDDWSRAGVAIMHPRPGGWEVVAIEASQAHDHVPSEGGPHPGQASPAAWAAAAAAAALLGAGSTFAIRRVGYSGKTS